MKSSLALTLIAYFFFFSLTAQEGVFVSYIFNQKMNFNTIQIEQHLYATKDRARLDIIPPNRSYAPPELKETDEGLSVLKIDKNKYDITRYFASSSSQQLFIVFKNNKQQNILLDDLRVLSWQITNETKQLKGYQVVLAKTTFRGRSYNAWFSPDVPIPFGPWKFKGLPGLIFEVVDEDELFSWSLSSLQLLNQGLEDLFFLSPKESEVTQTLQEHIYEWQGEQTRKQQQMISNLPRDGKLMKSSKLSESSIERIYEWEEEN